MADDFSPPSDDPFASLNPNDFVGIHNTEPENPFAALDPNDFVGIHNTEFGGPAAPQGSPTGAFTRGAVRGVLPAAGGLAGAGFGASIPAAIAGAISGGEAGVWGGPWAALGGAVIGGLAGSYGADIAQTYALSKAPDSWVEALGQDERQERLDQEQHPYASFLGGLAPYALTMSPFSAAGKLPENATALQRIMANPVTARVFGGAMMGGMELGQEATSGQPVDWAKVGIATGFGVILNRPNPLGEAIEGFGARPFRGPAPVPSAPRPLLEERETEIPQHEDEGGYFAALHDALTLAPASNADILGATAPRIDENLGLRGFGQVEDSFIAGGNQGDLSTLDLGHGFMEPWGDVYDRLTELPNPASDYDIIGMTAPTTRQAADVGVMDAGVDEDTFFGAHEQNVNAKMAAQDAARAEQGLMGPVRPDPDIAARRMEPELFDRYDDLTRQRDALRAQIDRAGNPPDEDIAAAQAAVAAAQAKLDAHLASANGYTGGPEARRLRVNVRTAQAEADAVTARRQAYEAGAGVDTPEVTALRQHLQQVDFALRDVGPAVGAARRRAAEALGSGAVAPESIPPARQSVAPVVEEKVNWDRDTVGNGQPIGDDMTVVDVPVAALDAAFKRDSPDFHVEKPKAQAAEHAAEGRPMSLPQVGAVDGKIGVDNGRNRIAVAREMGATTIPIAVEKGNVADVMAALRTEPAPAPALRTIEQQRGAIEDDVRRKLTKAGRPADEADASAKIVSALYETHAERLGGKAGTAEELYRKDPSGVELSTRLKNAFGKLTPDGIIRLAKDAHAGTFIHELGHDWLNRMVRDAQRLEATPALRRDVEAIRDWFGWKAGEPTKAQHEKFANAFERYLYDGVAPSPRLAGVFAKFRNWLVEVYRAIAGAVKPGEISEDIRGVFDRMLSTEPQRTIVSPEHPGAPSLADIHEVDARLVEPQDAAAAEERVDAERVRAMEDILPEIEHEVASAVAEFEESRVAGRAADAAGATGSGAGGLREVERGGAEAGTQPGGERVGAGSGAERAGVGAARAEGGSVSGGERPESTGRPKSQPLAPTPAETFNPTPDERLIDRAGNIRVENLTNVEELAKAIHASADRNDDFISARGQSTTKGGMLDLAKAMGLNPARVDEATLSRLLGGTRDLGAKVLAARKLVVDSARIVADLMSKVADSEDPQALADLARAIAQHDMIQSALSGVTAEWGRAGSAFHNLMEGWDKAQAVDDFLKQNTGRDLYQLKKIAKLGRNLDTAAKISKFVRDAQKRSFGRMILEYWVNALISGFPTHMTYSVGNTMLMLNKLGPETLVASQLGRLHGGEKVYAGEVGAGLGGLGRSLPRAAQAAIEGFRTGQTTLLPGETARPLTPFDTEQLPFQPRIAATSTNADVAWSEVRADLFGAFRGLRDGVVAHGKLLASGGDAGAPLVSARYSPLGQIPDIAVRGATVLPIGTLARAPSRMVAGIHSFFRVVNYSVENNAKAFRQATYEGRTGTDFDQRLGDLRQNPSEASMETSRLAANELTLMGQGGEFTKRLIRITNWAPNLPGLGETPVLKFVLPFVHIASNIIDQTLVHRTPIGFLSSELRADLLGRNGNIARDTAAARMIVGTALSVTFGGLAAEGYLTGAGPSDPKKATVWKMAGNQAHSIRIGDVWYDVHRLGALGMLSGIAADMYDVGHKASSGDMLAAGSLLMHAFTQNVLDESFMRGPSELIQAVEDPGRYGERYIQNFLSSFVPYSVESSVIDRATDPYTRQARTVMDAIKQKIPGLSETLFPRRDIWGEPMPNHQALLSNELTAIYQSRVSTDPVNLALSQLGMGVAPVPRSIRNVKLDDGQYDDFARLAGRMTKQRLDVIVRSPDWNTWPTHARRDVVQEIVKQSREAARGMMFMKYPSIPAQATRNRFLKEQDDADE